MCGYYLFFGSKSTGVYKKIDMQIHELEKTSAMKLITMELGNRTWIDKIKARIIWLPLGYNYEKAISSIQDPDFIYIRRFTADCDLIGFLSHIRESFPRCKILIEIFTYPYDKDDYARNLKHFIIQLPFYLKDLHYRKKYKYYVDRFITYSKDDVIFGVKTIKTCNGIYVDNIKPVNAYETNTHDEINLTSVAHMQTHHGFERLIKGLHIYYKKGGLRRIIYHVVGDGEEVFKYQRLVKKYNLESVVIFHGKLIGDELDAIYNITDVAISSLGLYKYNINTISTLKEGEYLSKGLPTVTGCKISLLTDEEPPFILTFTNDCSPIDINKVIRFYDNLHNGRTKEDVINEIRRFAKRHVDMAIVMKPITDYLETREN